jgi:molecular chaperone GrpE
MIHEYMVHDSLITHQEVLEMSAINRTLRLAVRSLSHNKLHNKGAIFGPFAPHTSTPSHLWSQRQFLSTGNEKPKDSEASVEEDSILPEVPSDKETIAKLEQEIKELKDKVVRSYAEEENVRRIAKRDVEQARAFANQSFAKALLDVADDLQRALQFLPAGTVVNESEQSLHTGIQLTEKQLQKVFTQFKVTSYGDVGDRFDPSLHDALFQVQDPTKESGTILQVVVTHTLKLTHTFVRRALSVVALIQ